MKKLLFIILLASCMVCGCRSKKVLLNEDVAITSIDTTSTTQDTASAEVSFTEVSKETAVSEIDYDVEFMDSGGIAFVDAQGNVTLYGIKNLKGSGAKTMAVDTNIQATARGTTSHNDINKGETNRIKRNAVVQETAKENWQDAIVKKVGQLCCIAALLYAIFLYIKRKR